MQDNYLRLEKDHTSPSREGKVKNSMRKASVVPPHKENMFCISQVIVSRTSTQQYVRMQLNAKPFLEMLSLTSDWAQSSFYIRKLKK